MLPPDYLDGVPSPQFAEYWEEAQLNVIRFIGWRINEHGYVTRTVNYQMQRLQEMGALQQDILRELEKATGHSQAELLRMFNEAAARTIASDDNLYRAAGYNPVPLAESPRLQGIIRAGFDNTSGQFWNLTSTTAQTATGQFERLLDECYMKITSGGYTYREAIKWGIKDLARRGIASIVYPSGHRDYMDVTFRRAALTGVNQAALKLQEARLLEIGTDLVETTAHHGARPSHAVWQGRVFSYSGTSTKYPSFFAVTGYGTGPGLGGWNCRHGWFPFFEGLSKRAYSDARLDKFLKETVTYNGTGYSVYDAKQMQRAHEREIRAIKREIAGLESIGEDTSYERGELRAWQAFQRDFLEQTGLDRDYFRERAGKQNM